MSEGASSFITTLLVIIIIGVAIVYFIRIKSLNDRDFYINRRSVEQTPSILSTLGVFGTFLGITIGLLNFDPSDLQHSIPLLLGGLKTAFLTSLAGMGCSLYFSKMINNIYDELDKTEQEKNFQKFCDSITSSNVDAMEDLKNEIHNLVESESQTRADIVKELKKMNTSAGTITKGLQQVNTTANSMSTDVNTISIDIQSGVAYLRTMQASLTDSITTEKATLDILQKVNKTEVAVQSALEKVLSDSQVLKATLSDVLVNSQGVKSTVESVLSNSLEKKDMLEAIAGINQESLEETKKFSNVLREEVNEIENKMADTNKLLMSKFDEFSELLKKSNTEALVEVMKKVTEEFEKQMSTLINKLIQENFEQLNKSVERLNVWQQENKEMITSLTNQYKQMATNFEATSTSLTQVDKDTQALVSEGGKLRQIIDALNKVIVEDEKFIKLTKELQETANLSKSNMAKFDEATNKLNDWVKKQRNFVDGVTTLITRLEELNKIKDYGEEFWKGTRRHMEEGVGIIKAGSETLNSQLTSLDKQFYSRLNTTLAELDACIQSMIRASEQRDRF